MYLHERRSEEGSMSTHAKIAIGVIIPVVVLVGGLVTFIWYTERQRRERLDENFINPRRQPRPTINSYLHRSSKIGVCTSQIDNIDAIEAIRITSSAKNLHELEDTELHHLNSKMPSIKRKAISSPPSPLDLGSMDESPRNDSAVQATMDRLESRDTDPPLVSPALEEFEPSPPHSPKRDASKLESRYSLPQLRSNVTSFRPSSQTYEFRSSLKNPTPGTSKREARVSRYSKEVRYSKEIAARFAQNRRSSIPGVETQQSALAKEINLRASRESLSAIDSPTVSDVSHSRNSTISLSDIISPTNPRNSLAVSPTNPRNSAISLKPERLSGSDLPSWMKRLSAQDVVEEKWRSDGELVPPENPRTTPPQDEEVSNESSPGGSGFGRIAIPPAILNLSTGRQLRQQTMV